MSVSVEEAAEYGGFSPDEPMLPGLLAVSATQVDQYLGIEGKRRCPPILVDHAILVLTADWMTRRNSPGGVLPVWAEGSPPARLARDVFSSSAEPILRRYRPMLGIG